MSSGREIGVGGLGICQVNGSGVPRGLGRRKRSAELLLLPSSLILHWDNTSLFPLFILSGLAATLCCGSGQLQVYPPNSEAE